MRNVPTGLLRLLELLISGSSQLAQEGNQVIARTWQGATPREKSDAYLRLMRKVALPDYRATPGNSGAFVLRRELEREAHFIMLTFWDSEESVTAFAGSDVTVAKYYDFDDEFLLHKEPHAVHFELYES